MGSTEKREEVRGTPDKELQDLQAQAGPEHINQDWWDEAGLDRSSYFDENGDLQKPGISDNAGSDFSFGAAGSRERGTTGQSMGDPGYNQILEEEEAKQKAESKPAQKATDLGLSLDAMTPQQQTDMFGANHLMADRDWKLGVLKAEQEKSTMAVDNNGEAVATEWSGEPYVATLEDKRENEVAGVGGDDKIDLDNMQTVVDQAATLVAAQFDDDARFPGLNITDTGFGVGQAVDFIMPNGDVIEVGMIK